MEEFLEKYLTMILEQNEININEERKNEIINNLMENDTIWCTLDNCIYEELEK